MGQNVGLGSLRVPEDDLAHFVIAAVERVDLGVFKVNHRGTGSAQYHPRMMLALLIYCYANGIFSSRGIERATHRDIGVRFVAANRHPDHDTIARFRRENFAAVSESFLQVLLLARELKLLRVGLVSVDGSRFEANASKHRSVTYERAGGLIAQLEGEIAALLGRAEAADTAGEEDPQALPKEIARREAFAIPAPSRVPLASHPSRGTVDCEPARHEDRPGDRTRHQVRADIHRHRHHRRGRSVRHSHPRHRRPHPEPARQGDRRIPGRCPRFSGPAPRFSGPGRRRPPRPSGEHGRVRQANGRVVQTHGRTPRLHAAPRRA